MDQEKIDALKAQAPGLESVIDELAGKYRRLAAVRTEMGVALFRNPKRSEWQRYLDTIFDEKRRARAVEQLARDLVVHPAPNVFAEWLEEFPAIPLDCADPLTILAKGEADAHAGK